MCRKGRHFASTKSKMEDENQHAEIITGERNRPQVPRDKTD